MTTYEKIKNCGTARWVCPVCGGHRDAKGKMCENCRKKFREENIGQPGCRKVKRPSRETLKKLIRTESFVGIGRMYGITQSESGARQKVSLLATVKLVVILSANGMRYKKCGRRA